MARFTIIFILGLLLLLTFRFYTFYSNSPSYYDGQEIEFQTTLLSEPKTTGKYQRITANLSNGDRIYITFSNAEELHYGDVVRIKGKIKITKKGDFSNQTTKAISKNRIDISMFSPKIEAVKNDQKSNNFLINFTLAITSFVRQNIKELFIKTLPQNEAGIMMGIVFGIDEAIPKDLMKILRNGGVMHVIAASGMNVTMVGGFLSSLFALVLRRQYALVLSILGIVFYALMAGFEPSIVRASIMGSLAFSAQIIGRQALAGYILLITGYIMLFVSPFLLFDIGFQLSFLSTIGLIFIRPIFERFKIFSKNVIGADLITTFVAQVATLPVILINFGTYSIFSILANSLVLWVIPPIMVIGGAASLTGMFFAPLGSILLYLSMPFLIYFEKMIALFSNFGQVEIGNISWQLVVGYYFLLCAIVLYFKNKR